MVRQCLLDSLTLSMDLERYQDAQEICEQFLNQFPDDEKVAEVRKLKGETKMKASMAVVPKPASVEEGVTP